MCSVRALPPQRTWRPLHHRREYRAPVVLVIQLTLFQSIDFVIPDESADAAKKALAQFTSLSYCREREACLTSALDRPTQPPAFHFHIDNTSDVTVGIYLQTETLWFLPPLRLVLAAPNPASDFDLASDERILPPWRPGRGSGAFKSKKGPVVAIKSHVLLEAYLRLYARNRFKRSGGFGIAMIAYMEEYVDDDGLLEADKLPEPLKSFYEGLRQGEKPVRQWSKDLQLALGEYAVDPDDSD